MRTIFEVRNSVNHSAPSGPFVIEAGSVRLFLENRVTVPEVVIRPICEVSAMETVNQRAPSGPVVMARTSREDGIGNSVKFSAAAGVAIPTAIPNQSTINKNE